LQKLDGDTGELVGGGVWKIAGEACDSKWQDDAAGAWTKYGQQTSTQSAAELGETEAQAASNLAASTATAVASTETSQVTSTANPDKAEQQTSEHDLEVAWAKAEQEKMTKQAQDTSLEQAWLKAENRGTSGPELQAAWLQAEMSHAQPKPKQTEADMEKTWLLAERAHSTLSTASGFELGEPLLRGAARRMLSAGQPELSTHAKAELEPAVEYYSTNDDVSIRVESRMSSRPAQVYLELQKQQLMNSWKVGMRNNQALVIGWGAVGTMSGMKDAIKLHTSGSVEVFSEAVFKGGVSSAYTSPSGLQLLPVNQHVVARTGGLGGALVLPGKVWLAWEKCTWTT